MNKKLSLNTEVLLPDGHNKKGECCSNGSFRSSLGLSGKSGGEKNYENTNDKFQESIPLNQNILTD